MGLLKYTQCLETRKVAPNREAFQRFLALFPLPVTNILPTTSVVVAATP